MKEFKKRRLDYRIRFQPVFGTPEERVLTYLRNHQINSVQVFAMQALRPYWLPLAVLEDDTLTLSKKQQFGRDAVRELLLHIDYICSSLELPRIVNDAGLIQISKNHGTSDKLINTQLDIELGNGEWGSLGTFGD